MLLQGPVGRCSQMTITVYFCFISATVFLVIRSCSAAVFIPILHWATQKFSIFQWYGNESEKERKRESEWNMRFFCHISFCFLSVCTKCTGCSNNFHARRTQKKQKRIIEKTMNGMELTVVCHFFFILWFSCLSLPKIYICC